jgi:hypothetical protein
LQFLKEDIGVAKDNAAAGAIDGHQWCCYSCKKGITPVKDGAVASTKDGWLWCCCSHLDCFAPG